MMNCFLIVICSLLACSKLIVQGKFAKNNIRIVADSVVYNCLVFAFVTLIYFSKTPLKTDGSVLMYAFIFGTSNVIFQLFYTLAMKTGPVSITVLVCNLSMIIPITFSVICFNEKLSFFKAFGMLLCFISFFLNVKKNGKKAYAKWIICTIIAFFANGINSTTQKMFGFSEFSGSVGQFVFFSFLFSFVISLIMSIVCRMNGKKNTFKISIRTILPIFIVGALLSLFQYLYTYANSVIDGVVLVPSQNGLTTALISLFGLFVFKEKPTKKQCIGIILGISSVILMSI